MSVPDPIRESYLFLPSYTPIVLYAAFFVAGTVALYGLYRRMKKYDFSISEFLSLFTKDFDVRLRKFVGFGLAQRKVLGGGSGGIMHGALFFGWLMLFIYTSLI